MVSGVGSNFKRLPKPIYLLVDEDSEGFFSDTGSEGFSLAKILKLIRDRTKPINVNTLTRL